MCNHCWHDTGRLKPMNPPLRVEVCCFCGEERNVDVCSIHEDLSKHGEFHPFRPRVYGEPDLTFKGTPLWFDE